jgi:hypothetical protein
MCEQLESLISYCKENARVCPMPMRWNELYDLLPYQRQTGVGWEPPLPLILAAWYEPALQKTLRLKDHLRWAHDHGELNVVDEFLRNLPEEEWFHFGD